MALIVALGLFLAPPPVLAQTVWQGSFVKAAKLAAAQGKPIFLVFHAEWCGPCHMLEDNVFTDPKVKALLKRVVGVKLDVDKNPPESKRFEVNGIPRMVLLASDGKTVLWDATGYRDVDTFLGELGPALGVKVTPSTSVAEINQPPELLKVRAALANGTYGKLKAEDPKAAQTGLAMLVENLGVFDEAQFGPVATLIQKAGKDAIPAVLAGMGHKHLAVRAGAYRVLLTMLGAKKPKALAFDPWAPAKTRSAQLAAWRQYAGRM